MKKFILGQSKEKALALIPERRIKLVQLDSLKVCVSRLGMDFFAFEPLCPHQKASLQQGTVTGFGELICPLHEYRFDLATGQVRAGKCPELKIYEIALTEQGLEILV